jgi:N-methylhydantoinase A
MRYRGQSYELSVPFDNDPSAAFHELHQKTYGYSRPEAPLEIVNLRLKAIGQGSPPHLPRLSPAPADPSPAWLAQRQVYFAGGWQDTAVYAGEALLPGNAIQGPALVVRSDTTILLAAQDTAQVDSFGNLNIAVGSSGRQ